MENKLLRRTMSQPPPPKSPIEPSHQPSTVLAPQIQQPIRLSNSQLPEPQSKPSESVVITIEEQPLQLPNAQAQQDNLDFPTLVVAFCLAGAVEIASHSLQKHAVNPMYFHSLSIMGLLALASIFVAKCIGLKQPKAGSVLQKLGVFIGVTAFFLAVTVALPLSLRIISWIIYAVSFLAILLCNCPRNLSPCNGRV